MNPQPNTPNNFNYNPNMGNSYSQPQNMQVPMTPEQYATWYNQQLQMMQQMQYMQQPMYGAQAPQMNTAMPVQPNYQMPQQFGNAPAQVPNMQMQQAQPVNPIANQPMMVNGELNPAMMQRDPNVLAFMAQAVKEKYKDQQVTDEFMQTEANRLYDDFGNNLVSHFEPMLTEEQLKQFDELLQNGSTQDQLLQYLMSCIPDLTKKIEDVLVNYKEKYLMSF